MKVKGTGYEFTSKSVRKKFIKTDFGKKCNKYLYSSIALFGVSTIIILVGFVVLSLTCSCKTIDQFIDDFGFIYVSIITVLAIIMCYFDGKRDGAIRQFELDLKKKDEKK